MTARAQRAAEVLRSLGWDVDYAEHSRKPCPHCAENLTTNVRFCSNCGARAPATFSATVIDDLEAAIQAALGEQRIIP